MIDLLILGGAYLYGKFTKKVDGMPKRPWTPEDARQGLLELAQISNDEIDKTNSMVDKLSELIRDHKRQIAQIEKELNGLVPANVGPQLDDISRWMKEHVESEEKTLQAMAKKQKYWNWLVGLAVCIALIFSVLHFFR